MRSPNRPRIIRDWAPHSIALPHKTNKTHTYMQVPEPNQNDSITETRPRTPKKKQKTKVPMPPTKSINGEMSNLFSVMHNSSGVHDGGIHQFFTESRSNRRDGWLMRVFGGLAFQQSKRVGGGGVGGRGALQFRLLWARKILLWKCVCVCVCEK